ncbi:MAG: hypothetical protein KAR39_12635 [Thermoplasmata archaeon]|nr:hypothetical protein [Thermoplasmata archaeon]
MVAKGNPYIAEFDEALEGWTDQRFVSRQQIRDHARFLMYIVNLADDDGWQYDGHALKLGHRMATLTVKATIDDTPQVVFTSGRTTSGCIRAFLRKLDEDELVWVPDKYRQ